MPVWYNTLQFITSEECMQANLEAITGSMFCGKSEELVRRLGRARYARKRIQVVTPKLDDRQTRNIFNLIDESKNLTGYPISRSAIRTGKELVELVDGYRPDLLGIDEAQFFKPNFATAIEKILRKYHSQDFTIIVCGLDMDFRGHGFGPMPRILTMANSVQKLSAICNRCANNSAYYTYRLRLPGGSNEQIKVGDADLYQARCLSCWLLPE